MFNANARSINKKIDELEAVLHNNNVIIIAAIMETWLNGDIESDCIHVSGYTCLRNDSLDRRGGGVM